MHKRIVEALKVLFEDWDKEHQWLNVMVKTQKTGGFWGMLVIVPEERKYLLSHLESIAIAVGRIYGEGLAIEKKNNWIIID